MLELCRTPFFSYLKLGWPKNLPKALKNNKKSMSEAPQVKRRLSALTVSPCTISTTNPGGLRSPCEAPGKGGAINFIIFAMAWEAWWLQNDNLVC